MWIAPRGTFVVGAIALHSLHARVVGLWFFVGFRENSSLGGYGCVSQTYNREELPSTVNVLLCGMTVGLVAVAVNDKPGTV